MPSSVKYVQDYNAFFRNAMMRIPSSININASNYTSQGVKKRCHSQGLFKHKYLPDFRLRITLLKSKLHSSSFQSSNTWQKLYKSASGRGSLKKSPAQRKTNKYCMWGIIKLWYVFYYIPAVLIIVFVAYLGQIWFCWTCFLAKK